MSKIAFIYPGQGAQVCGMGQDFYEQTKEGKETFDLATDILGFSVPELCFTENDRLDITEYTQAAMVTTSIAMTKVLEAQGVKPDVTAGLSLGEYCALYAAGVISEKDAIATVRQRGILMQQAVPAGQGAMAAVLAMDAAVIEETIADIEGVQIANYNCPGQIVISGKKEAVETACETMVLLKNETQLLPLRKKKNYVFIGEFAKKPRYQGGGSSHINAYRVENAYEEAKKYAQISYVEGFSENQEKTEEQKLQEAVDAARESDAAVIFAGLSETMESEAYDREHMRLPECQNRLIEEVRKVQPNIVVVLQNGAPVEMPWADSVPAILEAYLGGEAAGRAQAEILFGEKNPCAKLAETFPMRVQDNPSWLDFGGNKDTVFYGEGIFVGYRYYDKKEMEVLFPFGHGLSYTSFTYSDLQISHEKIKGREKLEASFTITNTGSRDGKEIAQIYVEKKQTNISRAPRELKGFVKTELQPGEQKRCRVELDERSFAYYSEEMESWQIEPGEYKILIGASSRDIRLEASVIRTDEPWQGRRCNRNTTLGELRESEEIWKAYKDAMEAETGILPFGGKDASSIQEEGMRRMAEAILQDTPLRGLRSHMQGRLTEEALQKVVDRINIAIDNVDRSSF